MKRSCTAVAVLLATSTAFAEPREPIDYIRCSSHMENAAKGAYMLHSGFPAGADVAESAGAARRCAELAGKVLQREEQRTAFQRAHRIFLMAIEVPSMTAVTELSVALAQFNATLR